VWYVAELLDVSRGAVGALAGAIILITAVDALNDMSSRLRTCNLCGVAIICLALVGGLV
jgi:hypothetical protein